MDREVIIPYLQPGMVTRSGAQLDIHKPKPVHSLKEFLSEIIVIVVGIAIALSGEQLVEWNHWRHVVGETRVALNAEIAGNLAVVQFRVDQAPCIDRRLAELGSVIAAHGSGAPIHIKGAMGLPQFPRIRFNVWKTALSSEFSAHLPVKERLSYSALYDSLDWVSVKTVEEGELWNRLSVVDEVNSFTSEDWAALRQARAQEKGLADKIDANLVFSGDNGKMVNSLVARAAELGIAPESSVALNPASIAQRDLFCQPIL